MAYSIEFASRAAREFSKLPRELQARLGVKIDALAHDPRPADAEKLTGLDAYRIRIGDYPVVYKVDDAERSVLIARVAHRRDVYRRH